MTTRLNKYYYYYYMYYYYISHIFYSFRFTFVR